MTYHVYFVIPDPNPQNVFKIGIAKNVYKRAKQIASTESFPHIDVLRVVAVHTVNDAKYLEKFLQQMLKPYKVNSKKDWFICDEYVLKLVNSTFKFWQDYPDLLTIHLASNPALWRNTGRMSLVLDNRQKRTTSVSISQDAISQLRLKIRELEIMVSNLAINRGHWQHQAHYLYYQLERAEHIRASILFGDTEYNGEDW